VLKGDNQLRITGRREAQFMAQPISMFFKGLVPVEGLREHSKTHTAEAGVGPFPVDASLETRTSASGYQD
jgi:hypothetical protein